MAPPPTGRSRVRKVIFLDIDGVLLPFPNSNVPEGELFPPSTLIALKRLWNHICSTSSGTEGGLEWVLSSTWRVQQSYISDIEHALQKFGIQVEVDDITDPKMHSERQWEIQDWIQNATCDGTTRLVWLALDDEELLLGDTNSQYRSLFEEHAIKTDSSVGLSEIDVDSAIQLWDKQLRDT